MGTELLYAISDPRLLDDYRDAIQEASERAIAAASSTQHSQGVVASFPIREWELPGAGRGMPLVLICDDVQDRATWALYYEQPKQQGYRLYCLRAIVWICTIQR